MTDHIAPLRELPWDQGQLRACLLPGITMHTLPARVKAFCPSPPSLPTPTRLPCRPAGLGCQLHAKLGRWAAEARTGMRAVPLGQATLGRPQGGELGPREGTVWPVTYTPQTCPGTWASAPGQTWRCAWMGLAEKPEMWRTPTQAGHPETPPPAPRRQPHHGTSLGGVSGRQGLSHYITANASRFYSLSYPRVMPGT